MDLQNKKLSRELNYDVIIEKTEEGILCRDNRQYNTLLNNREKIHTALSKEQFLCKNMKPRKSI